MQRKVFTLLLLCAGACSIARAQTPAAPVSGSGQGASSLALSPAVIMVRCKLGQSTTQTLTIVNHTGSELSFNLVTEDVVVSDGKRWFSPAGQTPNGIAVNSAVAPASVTVKAGEEASVQVTLTLPRDTKQRAVVTFFRGALTSPAVGSVGLGASLGTLITFNVSSDNKVEIGPIRASTQTASANVILSEDLLNTGSEPIIPKGVVVILDTSGTRVAKASYAAQRLLPGEQLTFTATNPAQLMPGHYRTLSSFEFERQIVTSSGEFDVRE